MVNIRNESIQNVKIYNPNKAFNGYTLYPVLWGKDAWLIDMNGNVINRWTMKTMPANHGILLPNGNLLWQGRGLGEMSEFGGIGTELVEVDWDGNEVWRYDDHFINHDFIRLKNGNTILNRYVKVPKKIADKVRGGIPGSELNGEIYSCSFQEITKSGDIVWEWNIYDHLDPDVYTICPLCPRSVWGYTNSLDVLPDGNIIFTLRFENTVAIIDKKSGDIKWSFGPEQLLGHMHNVSVLPNGNILIFDNGLHRIPKSQDVPQALSEEEFSRVLEVNIETKEIVWEYFDQLRQFYTPFCGGAQRLPNDNILICETSKGRLFEVTREIEIVWEYINPFLYKRPPYWRFEWSWTSYVFQAHRYSPDFEGFNQKDLNPLKYEWDLIKRKVKTKAELEDDKMLERLSRLGY
jgi:hypothetical protein